MVPKPKPKPKRNKTNLYEERLKNDILLSICRQEAIIIDNKVKRGMFVDVQAFRDLFVPIFQTINDNLVSLQEDFPETAPRIKALLASWEDIGIELEELAVHNATNYVEEKINRAVTQEIESTTTEDEDEEEEDLFLSSTTHNSYNDFPLQ
ncbi:MAG: hypothetical protein ACREVA_01185 [Burkholderiales bacterium]